MSLRLSDLVKRLFRRPSRLRAGPRPGMLRLEALEDRTVPTATVTVTALGDATEGGANGTFRVARTGSTAAALDVYVLWGGTAVGGTDYNSLSSLVTIPVGQSYADVSVVPTDDTTAEPTETVTAAVSSGMGYTAGTPATAIVHILDDETPEVTVAKVDDAAEGGTAGKFRFTRTGDLSAALIVNYTVGTGSGAATPGDDYTTLSGSVTIPAGEASADVEVAAADDVRYEGGETVTVTVASGMGYTVGSPSSDSLTITDDEAAPVYWVGGTGALWGQTTSWRNGQVPGSTTAVYLSGSGTYWSNENCTIPANATFAELHLVNGYSGTATLAGNLTVGNLELASGTLDQPYAAGGTDVTVTRAMLWTGGTLNSTANLANLTLSGSTATAVFSPTSAGTVSTGNNLLLSGGARIEFRPGEFNFTNNGEITLGAYCVGDVNAFYNPDKIKFSGVKQVNVNAARFGVGGDAEWDAGCPMYNSGGTFRIYDSATVKLAGTVVASDGPHVASYFQDGTAILEIVSGATLEVVNEAKMASGTLRTLYNPNLADNLTAQTGKLVGNLRVLGGTVRICENLVLLGAKHYGRLYVTGSVTMKGRAYALCVESPWIT